MFAIISILYNKNRKSNIKTIVMKRRHLIKIKFKNFNEFFYPVFWIEDRNSDEWDPTTTETHGLRKYVPAIPFPQ